MNIEQAHCTNNFSTFLIDSQADICVIKLSALNNNINFDTSNTIGIKGVTDEQVFSLGTITIKINFKNLQISHEFHVVPDHFDIPTDGIIGRDFCRLYKCNLDYDSCIFSIKTNLGKIDIELMTGLGDNEIVLPPRAEIFRIFKIKTDKYPAMIPSKEIEHGVFIANTLTNRQNTMIRMVNTTDKVVRIRNLQIEADQLSDYNVYTMNENEGNEKERTEKLMQILKDRVDEPYRDNLLNLCEEFNDIFALDNDKMTTNNFYTQNLRLSDDNPVYIPNYRTPHSQKEEINRQVAKLLENDLIEPSVSAYNSPIILVPKKGTSKEKKWRMCIDYRQVNKKLIADRFPLPRIDDILEGLGKAKYFSIMDLYSGFHQVPLSQESRDVTSFNTSSGSYKWKVLPFGLSISPNSFQRMMNIAFAGLTPEKAFLYVDDIIVIGRSEKHHLFNLKLVFQTLRKYNLKVNPEKCQFFKSQVTFLGHKCTAEGILPDDTKLKAVEKYPIPKNKDEVKRFVAFANYYRKFIPFFAEISLPLSNLTRKRIEFKWSDKEQQAFDRLKNALLSPMILQYPDFSKPFKITVDASNEACGGVLTQEYDGHDLPVAYFSRAFQKGERNKATIEKELLAIYHGITFFKPYIYGTKFTVNSDHKPLTFLFTMKNATSKLVRIRMELEDYDFEINYIPGSTNYAADALSRITIDDLKNMTEQTTILTMQTRSKTRQMKEKSRIEAQTTTENEGKIFDDMCFTKQTPRVSTQILINERNEMKVETKAIFKHKTILSIENEMGKVNEDTFLVKWIRMLESATELKNFEMLQISTNDDVIKYCSIEKFKSTCNKELKEKKIAIFSPQKIIKDPDEKERLIKFYHEDKIFGGHCGAKRLHKKLYSKFYWRNMTRDIAKYIKQCSQCILNKPKTATKEPLKVTETPQKPFDIIVIDTVGPLTESDSGNKYALTAICELSKYLISVPLPNKEAKTIAKAIFENIILIYGLVRSIKTDLGTEYKNSIVKELCELLKIEHNFSTAYHHETLGSIERNHRTLNEYLRSYLTDNNWDIYLKYFSFCYNISYTAANGHKYTPFELVFAKKCTLPEELTHSVSPVYDFENYSKIAKYTLQIAHKEVNSAIENRKIQIKSTYDKKANPVELKINDQILIRNEPYNKFKNVYKGPFRVKRLDDTNVTVDINDKEVTIHRNRTIKFKQ